MPRDLLAGRLPAPRDLLVGVMRFTAEQTLAIERRDGDLLLDAGAGSGKTSVLVERFVRAVREDGVEVGRILAITFTEKAAAELRERIRARLRELGDEDAARSTEGGWISTIHAFCARVLRTHALAAGLDPAFTVLEPYEADELASGAFDAALAEQARTTAGAELIAAHGPAALRAAIVSAFGELRSRGQRRPALPACPQAAGSTQLEVARVRELAATVQRELGQLAEPGIRVAQALDALARVEPVLAGGVPWPGELAGIALPNGATALKSVSCEGYREALGSLRTRVSAEFARTTRDGLDALLGAYADRYGELKAGRSALDFDDLELVARDLLARPEVGDRYRERFAHVMVDELQDTNRVQLELVDAVAGGAALFMVGDAQQSIYGFRHADVELFEARGRELEALGRRASLETNFRSRAEILTALNAAFATAIGERFRPLVPGREGPPSSETLVELLVVDKGAQWESDRDGLGAPWRSAEARLLAARVGQLIDAGEWTAGDVVLLTRATTDLRVYELALEEAGVPTYMIGGRGYWSHPQVVEMVSYLRALVNPLDEEAMYATLFSPLCGLSLDGLVLVAAGAREQLAADDRGRLVAFEEWFAGERAAAARVGAQELLDRALAWSGYDLELLARPDGRRRLANVRKLMRLAREWEAGAGTDLPGFLTLLERRAAEGGGSRESEAPVESEGLDAVRLMTIHRAKGLEFPVVCVADLGRGPNFRPELIRIGRDGTSLGLRVALPGSGERIQALDYDRLTLERREAEEAEERRLFYVAMTRAKERLILSGAAKPDTWAKGNRSTPVDWIVPAFVADVTSRLAERTWITDLGARFTFVSESDAESLLHPTRVNATPRSLGDQPGPPAVLPQPPAARCAPQTLSYSGLAEYQRCGYRFYVERVLGLPPAQQELTTGGRERGTQIHRLLQRLELRRPSIPEGTPDPVTALVSAFVASQTRARLAAATDVRREQRFAFPLGGVLITGTFDVLASEPPDGLLVVDYKSDRLQGESPEAVVAREYGVQRLIYALAALRTGAQRVEVIHLFLERADAPAIALFTAADRERLEAELLAVCAGPVAGAFQVAPDPHERLCRGCPAAAGLCSWPLELTARPAVDRLF